MARILIIDDDEFIRDFLRRTLLQLEHIVVEAEDGDKGMRLFRQEPADLVITDILMPEKEGIETIIELRQDFPEVKIIAISGGGTLAPEKYLSMAHDFGADRILTKPFSIGELRVMIQDLIPDSE